METNEGFKSYAAFIRRHGKDVALRERLFKEMAPFQRIVSERYYPLAAAEELDSSAIVRSLALLFGLNAVKRIVPVSAGDGELSASRFEQMAFVPLSLRIRRERLMDMRAGLPKSTATELVSVSYHGLGGDPLCSLLPQQFGEFFESAPREVETAGSFSPFIAHFFLGLYALIGDRADFGRLTGLLRAQRRAIILGEDGESPGEWFVLVR